MRVIQRWLVLAGVILLLIEAAWVFGVINLKELDKKLTAVKIPSPIIARLPGGEKLGIQTKLAEFLLPPEKLPGGPELFWESSGRSRGRYQVIGTVESLGEDKLRLRTNDVDEVRVDDKTVFGCMNFASAETNLTDYSQLYVDYQKAVPFAADAGYLNRHFNLAVFTKDEIPDKLIKNSWAYAWVSLENWPDRLANIVLLTYCY